MPKQRKQNHRKVNSKFFILCEGKKTEPFYFKRLKIEERIFSPLVEIIIVNTKKTSPVELIEEAKKLLETENDKAWVVFDKDGYTKHREAFSIAESDQRIKIAFSSISFEFWILLHFIFTTKSFQNSEEIINYLKIRKHIDFKKNDIALYSKIARSLDKALQNASKIRQFQKENNSDLKIWELNPYTNVDELISEMFMYRSYN